MPYDLLAQLLSGLDTFKSRAGRFAANPMQGIAERSGPAFGESAPLPERSAMERIQELMNMQQLSSMPEFGVAMGTLGPMRGAGGRQALEDQERRIVTGVDSMEGEAKYDALRDIARQLEELLRQPQKGGK